MHEVWRHLSKKGELRQLRSPGAGWVAVVSESAAPGQALLRALQRRHAGWAVAVLGCAGGLGPEGTVVGAPE